MSKVIVLTEEVGIPVGVNYADILNLTCAYITSCAQRMTETMKPEEVEEMFNDTNQAFSKCLENAFPDLLLREDLTVEAIMEAEDKLVAEKVADAPPIDIKALKEQRARMKYEKTLEGHKDGKK